MNPQQRSDSDTLRSREEGRDHKADEVEKSIEVELSAARKRTVWLTSRSVSAESRSHFRLWTKTAGNLIFFFLHVLYGIVEIK